MPDLIVLVYGVRSTEHPSQLPPQPAVATLTWQRMGAFNESPLHMQELFLSPF